MSTTINQTQQNNTVRDFAIAAGGGVIGGIAFGVLMGTMGMLPMVAALVGSQNAVLGFVVHMVISILIALPLGLFASRLNNWGIAAGVGAVYGVIWWVVGALVLMPLMLGMNEMVLSVGQPQIMSLVGHVIYGVLLGGTVKAVR